MTQPKPKIRLYVPAAYTAGQNLALSEGQSHYLNHVMRARAGDVVAVFNGSNGEWLAEVTVVEKKKITLRLKNPLALQREGTDLWFAFAPVKNKTELVVEKATELGVSRMITVFTRHAVVRSVNMDKLTAHAIEAAEQCGRHEVPEIETRRDLRDLLGSWPKDRILLFADESGGGLPIRELLSTLGEEKYAVLIGPEGGFAHEEQQLLKSLPFVKPFSMGSLILRADTAAVASLACVQAALHWNERPSFEVNA